MLAHSIMAPRVYAVDSVCGMNRIRIVTEASVMYRYLFLLIVSMALTLLRTENRKNMMTVESKKPMSLGNTEKYVRWKKMMTIANKLAAIFKALLSNAKRYQIAVVLGLSFLYRKKGSNISSRGKMKNVIFAIMVVGVI